MKHKRFSEEQIISVLKEHEAGAKVDEICRRHALSAATFHSWRKKYGGMEASDAKRLREIEAENAKLARTRLAHADSGLTKLARSNTRFTELERANNWRKR